MYKTKGGSWVSILTIIIAYLLCFLTKIHYIDTISVLSIIPLLLFIKNVSKFNKKEIYKKITITIVILLIFFTIIKIIFNEINLNVHLYFLIFLFLSVIAHKFFTEHQLPMINVAIVCTFFLFSILLLREIFILLEIKVNINNQLLFTFNIKKIIIKYLAKYFANDVLMLLNVGIFSIIDVVFLTIPIYIGKHLIIYGKEFTKEEKFIQFNPDYRLIWILIFTTVLLLIENKLITNDIIQIIGWNISLFILIIYFITGISIFIYFTKKFFFPKILTFIIIVLLSLIIILLNLIVKVIIITIPFAVGILDIWFDFRNTTKEETNIFL